MGGERRRARGSESSQVQTMSVGKKVWDAKQYTDWVVLGQRLAERLYEVQRIKSATVRRDDERPGDFWLEGTADRQSYHYGGPKEILKNACAWFVQSGRSSKGVTMRRRGTWLRWWCWDQREKQVRVGLLLLVVSQWYMHEGLWKELDCQTKFKGVTGRIGSAGSGGEKNYYERGCGGRLAV